MRILIVEQDSALRDILTFLLRREAYDVQAAGDWQAGSCIWRSHGADLIILGHSHSEGDAWETPKLACREPRTPVLIVSQSEADADIAHAYALGASDSISLPFAVRDLISRVQLLLEPPRTRREAAG